MNIHVCVTVNKGEFNLLWKMLGIFGGYNMFKELMLKQNKTKTSWHTEHTISLNLL